jgi:hypothetical protein
VGTSVATDLAERTLAALKAAYSYRLLSAVNSIMSIHLYSYENYFPAIEIEMIDFPISIKDFCIYFSPRIIFGIQPKEQSFFTSEIEFFGLIGSRFDFQINKNWLPYFEVVAKTDGWVAGNEFLEENISFILGISARY